MNEKNGMCRIYFVYLMFFLCSIYLHEEATEFCVMLLFNDGMSARAAKWTAAAFFLPAFACCLAGHAARAEQPAIASPQRLGAAPAQARPDLATVPAPRASLNADLNASADYYRGYRDALRDAARLSRPYAPYRGRANTNTVGYRTWPPPPAAAAGSTIDSRQLGAAYGQRNDAPPMQEGRSPERLSGARTPQGGWPLNGATGAADDRMPHPLPMPQSSIPQSYMLQPPTLQSQATPSQTLASGFDPAARPR